MSPSIRRPKRVICDFVDTDRYLILSTLAYYETTAVAQSSLLILLGHGVSKQVLLLKSQIIYLARIQNHLHQNHCHTLPNHCRFPLRW